MVVNSSPQRRRQGHLGGGGVSRRPLIGVTTSEVRDIDKPTEQGEPPQREMTLGLHYLKAVERAGGLPVVLPPLDADAIDAAARPPRRRLPVRRPGHPPGRLRGASRTRSSARRGRELDAFELELARRADARGLPILGICRGAQALNVARGGTLHQHLPDVTDGIDRAPPDGARRRTTTHEVRVERRLGDRPRPARGGRRRQHVPPPGRRRRSAPACAPSRHAPDGVDRGDRGHGPARTSAACSGTPRRSSTARRTWRCSPSSSAAARGVTEMVTRAPGLGRVGARRRPSTAWSVGVEEEVMLARPARLEPRLAGRRRARGRRQRPRAPTSSQETHGSAVELRHRPARHRAGGRRPAAPAAGGAARHAARLRPRRRAVAGTHPFATWQDVHVSAGRAPAAGARARCASSPAASRRSRCTSTSPSRTPRRAAGDEPHARARAAAARAVGQLAVLAGARQRPGLGARAAVRGLPALRACRASSPPTTTSSRRPDVLIRCGAFPEPTFIWWDLRLQPRYGTLEVRVMDAQTRVPDTAALVALVQALVRLEAEDDGLAAAGARRTRPRCSTRTASWRCATASSAHFVDPERARHASPSPERARAHARGLRPGGRRPGRRAPRCRARGPRRAPGPARQRAAARGPRGLISLVQRPRRRLLTLRDVRHRRRAAP